MDTTSLDQLIDQFQAIVLKDQITPDSLGSLLEKIVEKLKSAPTSAQFTNLSSSVTTNLSEFKTKLNSLQTSLTALQTSITELQNKQLANLGSNHFATNARIIAFRNNGQSTTADISGASAEHAGLMTADDKILLDKLTGQINTLRQLIITANNSQPQIMNLVQISALVKGEKLYIYGAKPLIDAGYVPYLFRLTSKRNCKYFNTRETDKIEHTKVYKGWNLYGGKKTIKITSDNQILFTSRNHKYLTKNDDGYTYDDRPRNLVAFCTDSKERRYIRWGRSRVFINGYRRAKEESSTRRIVLRFAIGFAKPFRNSHARITPSNMVSNLAEFAVVYDNKNDKVILSHVRP